MVEAALTTFSARGYGKTTMQAIADSAGVAVQTLYFTFHTKAELLQATYEHVVLGPEAVPPQRSTWWKAMKTAPDLQSAIAALVDGTVDILVRAAPLVWAVHSDPDSQESYLFNERLCLDGNTAIVNILADRAALRPGLTASRARDLLMALTGPHLFMVLTSESGWTLDEYRVWMIGAIQRELFVE